jgi:hypothetical protein
LMWNGARVPRANICLFSRGVPQQDQTPGRQEIAVPRNQRTSGLRAEEETTPVTTIPRIPGPSLSLSIQPPTAPPPLPNPGPSTDRMLL